MNVHVYVQQQTSFMYVNRLIIIVLRMQVNVMCIHVCPLFIAHIFFYSPHHSITIHVLER